MERVCGSPTQPPPKTGEGFARSLRLPPPSSGEVRWGSRVKTASNQRCSKKYELLILTARINFNP
jgi:hypothetical protein